MIELKVQENYTMSVIKKPKEQIWKDQESIRVPNKKDEQPSLLRKRV